MTSSGQWTVSTNDVLSFQIKQSEGIFVLSPSSSAKVTGGSSEDKELLPVLTKLHVSKK